MQFSLHSCVYEDRNIVGDHTDRVDQDKTGDLPAPAQDFLSFMNKILFVPLIRSEKQGLLWL